MAEFKLDRFKYRWRGNWQPATAYRRDDIVRLNGKSYVCLVGHTSDSDFEVDLNYIVPESSPPLPDPRWVIMTGGRSYVGNWTTSTNYYLGDIVTNNGSLYICIDIHTSTSFDADETNWELFADHISYEGDWTDGTPYARGAIVRYGGQAYRCLNPHTATGTLETNEDDWEVYYSGIEFKGNWLQSTLYKVNDLVKYGGSIFKCNTTHTSGEIFSDTRFDLEFLGFQYDGEWNSNTLYQVGDVVTYGGFLWYCLNNNVDSDPYETDNDSTDNWTQLTRSYNFRGDWVLSGNYRPGDIVLRGGDLYLANVEIGGTEADGSSLDIFNTEWWTPLNKSLQYQGQWENDTFYSINDVVIYFGTTYVCVVEHSSDLANFPGDNGNGFYYWETLIERGSEVGMSQKGDLLTYNLNRTFQGDGSSFGATAHRVGTDGQVLTVTDDDELFWKTYLNDAEVVYVTTQGVDAIGYGSIHKPFRTVRYACEFVEDNFDPLTPVKIAVSTGRYTEIGPISVPAGCVVMGDELRSTTIEANRALPEYQNDYAYVSAYFDHFLTYIDPLLNGTPITPTPGNTETQITGLPLGSNAALLGFQEKLAEWRNYVEFRIADGEEDPTVSGTNTITTDGALIAGAARLMANREFFTQETFAWLNQEYPDVTHSIDKIRTDVYNLIRGIAYDLQYTGNYKTLLSARRYANAVTGSQLDDLFYFRDTTGIRNCTLEGLDGVLNPPGAFELFRRPTGGAFCSLDPGWGPADDRTWIINRSPYLQGVTNIGSNCVGQKIDGALHNGGNKSMVSNDFTQVLSDGIGAYILNNGKAELVSVFTYYCAIGYFAENGGTIRATNGNNSYGRFGAIADGNDPQETPKTAKVFNRNNEALVSSVFAGEFTDQIFLFEYSHAGEHYTTASSTVVGSGADVETEYTDFRDGGIYQLRLINPEGSGVTGGSGYNVELGNAQSGNTTSITLAGTSDILEDDILNTRILITSGDGTGQYGYVQSYNNVSKVVQVYKESDGTPGWDHVVPGTPIEPTLTTNAQYRIEPRIVCSHPGFTTPSNHSLAASTDIVDATHGETSQTFFALTGVSGTGDTDESVTPAIATFDVTRTGQIYNVEINSAGAGYAVDDEIIITGDNLGGTTPTNDLTITVTAVSDDSTNSIVGFTTEGVGVSGRFVAISTPNFAQYSDDGETWTQVNLPAVRDWKKIASGNGSFVAIASGTNAVAYSTNGETWVSRTLPVSADWVDIAYGDGKFVIVAENSNVVAVSTNGGLNWSSATIPADLIGDSTASQWLGVEYGQGKFVAIAGGDAATATSENGTVWNRNDDSTRLPLGYESANWVGYAYGNNRWIAITENGDSIYSLDGGIWYQGGSLPVPAGATSVQYKDLKYSQGVFMAVLQIDGNTATSSATTTEDGLIWTERDLGNSQRWQTVSFASLNEVGTWVALATNSTSNAAQKIVTGARAKFRANVTAGSFSEIKIWDPGSGYTTDSLPTITIYDNTFGTEVGYQIRIDNGVLAQPDFINRGTGYRSSSTTVTITGDGYADIIPEGTILTLYRVENVPGQGTQIRIDGILDTTTETPDDLILYTAVTVTDLGDDGTGAGTRLVEFRISPSLEVEYNLAHDTDVELRTQFSQCRISGHDFLDIGTGNFEDTNYPDLYAGGAFFVAAPENEVVELNGGRVYYTSTDQDGNFRAGELFSVQQSTGIVTISADFFQLDGLSELALGGVRLGGSGTVIREFSTDPNFTEDSNNVVPTQRAIATFIANRLSEGGSELELNEIRIGQITIGGIDNEITSATGSINVRGPAIINGDKASLNGLILAQNLLLRDPFNDTIQ